MKTTITYPTTNGHPISFETDRRLASQARAEALSEGIAYVNQLIRDATANLAKQFRYS